MKKTDNVSDRYAFFNQPLDKNTFALYQLINASQNYIAGLSKYAADFMAPYLISTAYFKNVEAEKSINTSPLENFSSYLKLLDFNFDVFNRGLLGG